MTDHFARLLAEHLARLPAATSDVIAALVSKGHRVMLDQWRADLTPDQRDADNAVFVTALADALDALTIPGARASDTDDLRARPSTLH
jgi:hypothetical protein